METIEETLKAIRKLYGDESIFTLSNFQTDTTIESISTNSLMLDYAIGIGGVPRGRFTEVYGCDGAGKTTLCLNLVSNAQKEGLNAAYIDVENVLDVDYMKVCGVDLDTVLISQPNFQEEAMGIAETLIQSGNFGLVVIDSIAALSPKIESEDKKNEQFGDKNVTGMIRSKLLKVFFRRVTPYVRKNNVAVVLTNQLIDNTSSFFGGTIPPGGHGTRHYASVRIELNKYKKNQIKSGEDVIGQLIEFSIIKNRVGQPYRIGTFPILFGHGIDAATDVVTTMDALGIHKRGAYYIMGDELIGHGKAATIEALRENPELLNILRKECKEILKHG